MAAEAQPNPRPYDDFNFEELLSDPITVARVIRPHLGSRLVSVRLTFGVHSCTLSREERCGRRTNPMKSTCTSTTPQLSERAGADACLSTLYSKIDPSELAAKGVLRRRRLCCLRRETAFSPESAAGSSEAGSYRSPFCASSGRGADRRWGFGASLLQGCRRWAGFPHQRALPGFRLSSQVIGRCSRLCLVIQVSQVLLRIIAL